MLSDANRANIENWINESPDFRRIESTPLANDAWETRALEDGQIVFEEVDLDTDRPVLNLLAAWCERQTKLQPRPPVKTSAAADEPERLRAASGHGER